MEEIQKETKKETKPGFSLKNGLSFKDDLSLKWKLFMYLLSFSAMLLIILWLFQIAFLDEFYRQVKTSELRKTVAEAEAHIEGPLYSGEDSELPAVGELSYMETLSDMQAVVRERDLDIEIVDSSGNTLFSAQGTREPILSRISALDKYDIYDQTIKSGGSLTGFLSRHDELPLQEGRPPFVDNIIYCEILSLEGSQSIMIMASTRIVPLDATTDTLRTQLYFITALMIISSVALAFIISGRIARPIEEINQSAKVLSKGNYDVTFSGKGYKEIKELSDTLAAAARDLGKAEGYRRELLANVSHDLRTPLTLIGGYAEAMRDLPGENNAENAQIIIDEASRLSEFVNDMLEISKLQSGAREPIFRRFSLTDMLASMTSTTAELLRVEGYDIRFEKSDEDIYIEADEKMISQAFYNILINAVNYTGSDKKVTVRQVRLPYSARIEVSDTGNGISEQELPHIWERYYKSDKSHNRAIKGSGLGLSIVRSIAELHAGSCGAGSYPGKGSTFWIEIPFYDHSSPA